MWFYHTAHNGLTIQTTTVSANKAENPVTYTFGRRLCMLQGKVKEDHYIHCIAIVFKPG